MTLFALLVTGTAFSQVFYGLKGGINLADFTNMRGTSDWKTSFYAGGFLEYRASDFGVSPELIYSRQGFQAVERGDKMRVRVNYLNLPVVIKLYVVEGFSFDLGTQVGYVLNSKVWAKSGSQTVTADLEDALPGVELNTFDAAFVMGFTCNVKNFFLQSRYNLGIASVAQGDNSRNSVLQFGIGYRFR